MSGQIHAPQPSKTTETEEGGPVKGLSDERREEVKAKLSDTDDLLDEMDDLLEELGETFAAEYVQKGGQ